MYYRDLLELARIRRSCRRFTADPVPKEVIEKILDIARYSPSAANSQPWEFVVVTDSVMKKAISKEIVATYKEAKKKDPGFNFEVAVQPQLFRAPVLIVVCGDRRMQQAYPALLRGRELLRQSLAICSYAIQLAATSFGLATAWATIHWGPPEAAVKKLLAIPDVFTVDHIIPIGYPDIDKEKRTRALIPVRERAPFRRELQDIVSYERYDMTKYRSDKETDEFIWSKTVTRIRSL
jgi:coenzyme F420-0:L-glutamate ligase/coenzyme F420-1:gamma-L-glutamate ligase